MEQLSSETPPTTPAQSGTDGNDNMGVKTKKTIVIITHFVLCVILILSGLDMSMHGIQFSFDSSVQIALVGIVGLPVVRFWRK